MGHRLRVVVADDDRSVRELVGVWLSQLGHTPTVVAGDGELLAACRTAAPDLVVSDVGMTVPDGLAAAAVLRGELGVPVVLMSASWDVDRTARAAALGVTRLAKPFRPLELVRAVDEALPARHRCPSPLVRAGDALFRQLVETAEEVAILTLDPGGSVTHWNTGAARLFGYTADETLGGTWERIFSPADRAAGVPGQELTTAATGGKAADERWHVRKDGSEFWASGVLTALRGPAGSLLGYGKIVRDRTDQKEREVALQAHAAALREVDAKRTRFLATLAHELRNPLAPLRTYAHLLRLRSDDPDVQGIAAGVERQVGQLTRLVDDLMDTARVCQGKVTLDSQRVDLRAIVGLAVDTVSSRCVAAGHELVVAIPTGPVWLDGDPDRLCQVVVNLLTNAIKYTPGAGRIGVALEAAGSHVVLRVSDTGVGIAADQLPAVFDLFTQDDRHRAHAQGGLGIGLAVVRELVILHGGTVRAASDGDGRGSEFIVRLPSTAVPAECSGPGVLAALGHGSSPVGEESGLH